MKRFIEGQGRSQVRLEQSPGDLEGTTINRGASVWNAQGADGSDALSDCWNRRGKAPEGGHDGVAPRVW